MAGSPRRPALADTAYDIIRQRLMDHDIEPGSKMNIHTLAGELGLSPTPLREALVRLEGDGLVVRRSLAGYTAATPLGRSGLDDLFGVRLLLEPTAAAHAATRAAEADLERLTEAVAGMRAAAEGSGERAALLLHLRHNSAFHDRIALLSDNAFLRSALQRLYAHTHRYRLPPHEGWAGETCTEHERILQAVREHDEETAAARMRTHLRRQRERLAEAAAGNGAA